MSRPAALLLALLAASVIGGAQGAPAAIAPEWKMDPADSRLEFIATFETAPAPGVFRDFDARLSFDPQQPEQGRLDVAIQVSSADMGNRDANKAIRGAEWFDVARYPQAEFHASSIRRAEANRYVARGTLVLKGVRQVVEFPFAWNAEGGATGATLAGEVTLKRADFGIGTGEWAATRVIGPDVRVQFKVRLRRAG